MRQLTLAVPDELAERLDRLAADQQKSVEQVVLELLADEPRAENLEARYRRFLDESRLFVQYSAEEKRRHSPVSEERLRELGAKFGAAGPVSELIIEERGER
jgi:hypothetical protein